MSASISFNRLPLKKSVSALSATGRLTPPHGIPVVAGPVATFRTSAQLNANPIQKKKGVAVITKGRKTLRLGKNKPVAQSSGRPPAPGERKAMRKRIVLSNTNALEVPGLKDITVESSKAADEMEGKVYGIPGRIVDSLRAVEAFKNTQGWHLFWRPATLIRRQTVELIKLVDAIESNQQQNARKVIVGDRLSGKSILLLQAQAAAFTKGWVVINIPDAQELVIGHTDYTPSSSESPFLYLQNSYTATLLAQISKANKAVLSELQVVHTHNLPIPLQPNISLERLADLGARDPDIAWPVFQALWKELTAPTAASENPAHARLPVLLAMDGLDHVMRNSAYLDANLKPIHAHDLALVNHFVSYLSGAQELNNGGMVLAATTQSNRPNSPALRLAVAQQEARMRGTQAPGQSPFRPVDTRSLASLQGVDVVRLTGLSKEEARAMMEYYAASGLLRQTVDESLVGEKWALSGGGIVGELEKTAVRMRV